MSRTSGLRPGENHGTRSECSACGEVFCGVSAFDAHRVGEHGTASRRCLTPAEMDEKGLSPCSLGRWSASRQKAESTPLPRRKTAGTRSGADRVEAAS